MVQAATSAFFSFCEERYGIAHPGRHMKRRCGAKERERFLSDDELRRGLPVMRELGYPRGDVMLFSLFTGRRLREITDMTWSEVDLGQTVHRLPAAGEEPQGAHAASLRGRCGRVKDRGGQKDRERGVRVPRRPGPSYRRNPPCSHRWHPVIGRQ
jgi:integrase